MQIMFKKPNSTRFFTDKLEADKLNIYRINQVHNKHANRGLHAMVQIESLMNSLTCRSPQMRPYRGKSIHTVQRKAGEIHAGIKVSLS